MSERYIVCLLSRAVSIYDKSLTEDALEDAGFVTTVHGKGTYVTATDKQLALEARRKAVEDDFMKVIDRARSMGLDNQEIIGIVNLLIGDD